MDTPCDAYPFIIRQAGDAGFVAHAQELIRRNAGAFRRNVQDLDHRQYWTLTGDYDPQLMAKKHELAERFGLKDWVLDPLFGDLIGRISEGGAVHSHIDAQSGTRMHVRINLLVRAAEAGCVPLLDDIPIAIAQGDAWLNLASHCCHATTPVIGGTARSVISYGLQLDHVEGFGLYSRYLVWKKAHEKTSIAA